MSGARRRKKFSSSKAQVVTDWAQRFGAYRWLPRGECLVKLYGPVVLGISVTSVRNQYAYAVHFVVHNLGTAIPEPLRLAGQLRKSGTMVRAECPVGLHADRVGDWSEVFVGQYPELARSDFAYGDYVRLIAKQARGEFSLGFFRPYLYANVCLVTSFCGEESFARAQLPQLVASLRSHDDFTVELTIDEWASELEKKLATADVRDRVAAERSRLGLDDAQDLAMEFDQVVELVPLI